MSKRIIIFSAVLVTIFGLPIVSISYAGPPGRRNAASKPVDLGYVPGELLVRFAPKANGIQRSRAERNQIVSSLGAANVTKDCGNVLGLSHVKLPPGVTVEQAMARLNKRPDIIYAQPNHYLMLCSTPNDTRFGDLWGTQKSNPSTTQPKAPRNLLYPSISWRLRVPTRGPGGFVAKTRALHL
jgi:hypothetical protein